MEIDKLLYYYLKVLNKVIPFAYTNTIINTTIQGLLLVDGRSSLCKISIKVLIEKLTGTN